jgi:hypothetical protein
MLSVIRFYVGAALAAIGFGCAYATWNLFDEANRYGLSILHHSNKEEFFAFGAAGLVLLPLSYFVAAWRA